MRQAFIDTLCDLASQDSRIWLLCGDLGFSVLEQFSDLFPDRFINVGIAEQNMLGVAAGLALSGKIVFVYSLGNFPTLRCLEQLRNDICYHNLNVNIIISGGGVSYGPYGYSHHTIEDIAILRTLPNLMVTVPANSLEVSSLISIVATTSNPSYIRLKKNDDFMLDSSERSHLKIGNPLQYYKDIHITEENKKIKILIICLGSSINLGFKVKSLLVMKSNLISISIWSCPFVKPLVITPMLDEIHHSHCIVTLEDSSVNGGLGTIVIELMSELKISKNILRFGIPDQPYHYAHSHDQILESFGLSASNITFKIMDYLCLGF